MAKTKLIKLINEDIANQLMLEISLPEAESIALQIESTLKALEQIKDLELDAVEPLVFPKINFCSCFRSDQIQNFANKQKLIACAPKIKNNLVEV